MNRLDRAISIAVSVHAGQFDKVGRPVIFHPIEVMLQAKGEDEQVVSILHDTVEDSPDPERVRSLIKSQFGDTILVSVDALTHRKGEPYNDYISRCMKDPVAHKVKIIDVLCNFKRLDGLPEVDQERLHNKYSGALRILCGD